MPENGPAVILRGRIRHEWNFADRVLLSTLRTLGIRPRQIITARLTIAGSSHGGQSRRAGAEAEDDVKFIQTV
ncbi:MULTISPECIES: hypothetical protein [Actinomadura]|uniref:Uncharacterized protein n=1 Tax=Actinomadura geliboluensis TaxID=882440 RepID=A0A5S4GXE1_9ACTN|nr:hypothetical protein [Actinomadura geliboluensis]TMR37663.1 hypothetical protein ETD96_18025 [Actinomadura geliboluensis]